MLPNVSYVNTSERVYFMKIKLKYLYEFFTAIASTLVATTIYAQPYPTKPVKVFTGLSIYHLSLRSVSIDSDIS